MADCDRYGVAKTSLEVAGRKQWIADGLAFGCIANEHFAALAYENDRWHLGNMGTESQRRSRVFASDGGSSEACTKVNAQCICAHLFRPVTKVPFVARRNLARVASRGPPPGSTHAAERWNTRSHRGLAKVLMGPIS